jgi:fructose-1,6-bisphosphatase/inositol monophosphatase family enzyme
LRTFFLPEPLKGAAEQSAECFKKIDNSMSAGYDYPALVSSKLQFLFYYRTLVWDHAPGVLIAQEAGAIAQRPDGSTYSPVDNKVGLLCASSRELWLDVQAAIVPSIEVTHFIE